MLPSGVGIELTLFSHKLRPVPGKADGCRIRTQCSVAIGCRISLAHHIKRKGVSVGRKPIDTHRHKPIIFHRQRRFCQAIV